MFKQSSTVEVSKKNHSIICAAVTKTPAEFVSLIRPDEFPKIQVYGLANSRGLEALCSCLNRAMRASSGLMMSAPQIIPLHESDWTKLAASCTENDKVYIEQSDSELQHNLDEALLTCNGVFCGKTCEAVSWLCVTFKIDPPVDMDSLYLNQNVVKSARQMGRTFVFFKLGHNGVAMPGVLVFQLFNDLLPRTCDHFTRLCCGSITGPSPSSRPGYRGSMVHRIVPGGWIQVARELDDQSPMLADENYSIKHDRRGRLSFIADYAHTARAQFVVSLSAMSYLQGCSVAFGQLVRGAGLLRKIELIKTHGQAPIEDVTIVDCGIYSGNVDESGQKALRFRMYKHTSAASTYDVLTTWSLSKTFTEINSSNIVSISCQTKSVSAYKITSSASMYDVLSMSQVYNS